MLQEAKNEIENFGPNPALIGQGLEDSSGRAIQLLQQAGIAELGPYLSAYKNWKIRVYRDIWNIIQRYWTAERWIRVTDDQNVAQFFQINKQGLDEYGRPAIVNAIGSLDVDIIIDEGPDAVNMQGDSMMVLQSLGPQFGAVPGYRAGAFAAAELGQEADAGQDQAEAGSPAAARSEGDGVAGQGAVGRSDGPARGPAGYQAQQQQDMALQTRQQQLDEQQSRHGRSA
jgi:hypothetical protein